MLPISDLPVSPALPEQAEAASVAAADVADVADAADAALDSIPGSVASAVPAAAPSMSPAACSAQLKQLFPALFTGMAKPLKLRIQADIQTRAPGLFTKQLLSVVLRRYTGSHSYLVALTQATQRFDLDGTPAGELSAEHKQAAMDELTLRRATLREAQRTKQRETPRATQRENPTGTQRENSSAAPRPAQAQTQAQTQNDAQNEARNDAQDDAQDDAQRDAQRDAQKQAQRAARETQRKDAAEQALEDQKRRNRATLLHDFENTTLTPANFSALKGITVEAMEGYLAKAREEGQARRSAHTDASQAGTGESVRQRPAHQRGDRPRHDGRADHATRRGPPR